MNGLTFNFDQAVDEADPWEFFAQCQRSFSIT